MPTPGVRVQNEPSVEVVKLPKSGGVVALSREARKALRDRRIQDYYYGVGRELQPATQTLLLSDVSFFRVAGNTNSHAALLPAGVSSVMDPLRIVAVEPSDDLVRAVNCQLSSYAVPAEPVSQMHVPVLVLQTVQLGCSRQGRAAALTLFQASAR